MTEKPLEERRQYERYFKSVPLSYELERDGEWVPGSGQLITVDMSAGGAKVRCEEPVKVGHRLAISMTLEGAHFSTLATVVWVSPSRVEGHTIAGLRFEDLDDSERGNLEQSLRDVGNELSTLHAVSQGTGDTVLLLHSGGMSSRQWRKLGERLAARYRVVMPDMLGCGGNPPWPHDEPFDLQLDVVGIAALVSGDVHLVGHSYGGLLALLLARQWGTRVRSLAVYDPTAFGVLFAMRDPAGIADLERLGRQPVFFDDARGGGAEWMEAFVDYWNGPGAWQAMPAASRDAFLRVGRKVYYEVSSLMRETSPASSYAAIVAPTLLLHGEKSPTAARRVVEVLADALPHATLQCVAGAGHMGPITHADAVNELIAAHIISCSGARECA